MQRVVTHQLGDLENLVVEDGPDPRPGPGEVLVAMRASVVSYVNAVLAGGQYQVPPPVPFVPGTTGTGLVVETGPGVDAFVVGDRVAVTSLAGGCWTSHAVLPVELLATVTDEVDEVIAAAVLEAWCTMHFAFTRRRALAKAEVVLVLGASGAIGSAAVDIARSMGAQVIAVASSRERLAAAERLGADVVEVGDGVTASVRDLAPGGVDVVVDPVGGALGTEALKLLAPGGELLVLGFASGDIPRFGANRVLIANRRVTGVDLGFATTQDPLVGPAVMSEVLAKVASGDYGSQVAPQVCSLADAPDRLRAVAGRAVAGQVVAVMSGYPV